MSTKKKYLPSKRSFIDSFLVMDVLEKSNSLETKGRKVYHLELGEPLPRTPKKVLIQAKNLLKKQIPGYTPSNGIFELREAISKYYIKNNIVVNENNVFITVGSSGAFLLTFLACFDPGDAVVIFSPSYPAYRNILKSLGIKVIEIYNFQQFIDIHKKRKIKGLIVSNPTNPTGKVFDYDELKIIYDYCDKSGITLISDEIYHGIEFGKKSYSLRSFGENTIVINSFSKYFCMPGWRLGWVIIPNTLKENFLKLAQNLFISSGNIAQYAAVKVFDCIDQLNQVVNIYEKNKNYVFDVLKKTAWNKLSESDGAFYTYIDISEFSQDSFIVVKKILDETGVALTPGTDFDKLNGRNFIRLSFSGEHQLVKEALDILSTWIKTNY